MAKAFRALSNIEHGEEKVGSDGQVGVEITRIPYGAIVEGLDKDTMKNLWDAGVLEEIETSTPTVTRTVTQKPPAEDKRTAAEKAADEKKEAAAKAAAEKNTPPAAPGNTGGVSPSSEGGKA
jgi:hypothetical protein